MNTHREGPLEGIGQIAIRVRDPDRNLMALMEERPLKG